MADAPRKNTLIRAALEALGQGNHAEAVRCCKHALKQDRLNYDAYVVLGKSLYASKQFEQAEASYRRAADMNPGDSRAWQGLVELYEATEDYVKLLEACKAAISVFHDKVDVAHAAEYTRRLANIHVVLQDYHSALDAWKAVLEMKPVSKGLLSEALSGIVESKAVLMESWIHENAERFLVHDSKLDIVSARRLSENKFVMSKEGVDMEKALWDIHKEIPSNEKYETLLLQLLAWRLRATSFSRGDEWRQSCMQVLQLCLSAVSWHPSSLALVLLLAICEEDNVNDVFSEMSMSNLAQGRSSRLCFLGKRLAHAYPDQPLLMPVLAFLLHKFCSASLVQKKSICENALQLNQKSILGWQVLAELRVFEGAYSDAIECTRKGLHVVNVFRSLYGLNLQRAEFELQLILADAYVKSGNHDEASEVYQTITEVVKENQDLEIGALLAMAKEGQVKLLLAQGRIQEASSGLKFLLSLNSNSSWALSEEGWLAYQRKDFVQAITLLERAVHLEPSNAKYHYRLGLAYCNSANEKDKALKHLLESAKLDSNDSDVFCTLGHYHRDVPGGLKRAIRCYQKAVSINCENSEAGEMLCDLLSNNGQEMIEYSTCREASERSPSAFWAFRRLGYLQLRRNEWPEAAKNLQHAVRGYPACPDVWEALGSAYQQLGMLTAALKAYGRVVTVDGQSSLYALQQSGNVLMMLGMYRKAVLMFQHAVDKAPEHPATLFGLASALLGQACECSSNGAVLWGASLLQEASVVAYRGLAKCGNIGSFWKLYADIEISYARTLPWDPTTCNLSWSKRSQHQETDLDMFDFSVRAWKEVRVQAALRSKQAYQHAVHIQPHKGNLYADLCACLYTIQQFTEGSKNSWRCSLKAESVAYSGLALEQSNADFWTLLGIVAQNKAVQQCAFIQALYLDGNQALAWAELGQIYLTMGEQELAEEAFARARSVNPMLGLTWAAMSKMLGQNMSGDLKDCFANISYAAHLSPIPSFQLGLARFAAATNQLDSVQVYAAVDQAVLGAPHLPEAHNFKGLVSELQGKYSSAIAAFRTSMAAMDLKSVNVEPGLFEVKKQAASINLARVLCKSGDCHAAVQEYESLAKLGSLEDSAALRGYSTALWQSGQEKLAVSIAKVAVKKSASQTELDAAVQLLAKVTYNVSGPAAALKDIYAAASSLQTESAVAVTTAAISAMGGMPNFILQKMPKWIVDFNHDKAAELAFLLSISMQLQQETASAFHFLQKMLHTYPHSLSIRANLMQIFLERSKGLEVDVAARCCSSFDAIRLEKAGDLQQLCRMLSAAAVACSLCGNIKSQFSFASCNSVVHLVDDTVRVLQRWMHLEPWNIMSQYHLILSLVQQAREQRFPVNNCKAIQRLIGTILARMASNSENTSSDTHNYMHLQLFLCMSEVSLHDQNVASAIQNAISASKLTLSQSLQALPHVQLSRCYVITGNLTLAEEELQKAGDLSIADFSTLPTMFELSVQIKKEVDLTLALKNFESTEQGQEGLHRLKALVECKKAEVYIRRGDLLLAERAALSAVVLWPEANCLDLLHGAICLELVKGGLGSVKLQTASRRLMKASSGHGNKLPIAGLLLAQAQAGKSSTPGWERLLREEWAIWPAEYKPAELYFQMGRLAMASKFAETPDAKQSPKFWFSRAVHLNPSCLHYWTMALQAKMNDP